MKYTKGYKYQTTEFYTILTPIKPPALISTHFLTLEAHGRLSIERGYAWDGPSGPTIDTDNAMTPSLVHDAFAQLMRMGLLDRKHRIPSNAFMKKMLLARGMFWLRAKYWIDGLWIFGGGSVKEKNRKKVYSVV